jgi:hypothetical protein
MPGLIRHPVPFWIPAFAGMTTVGYLAAGVISLRSIFPYFKSWEASLRNSCIRYWIFQPPSWGLLEPPRSEGGDSVAGFIRGDRVGIKEDFSDGLSIYCQAEKFLVKRAIRSRKMKSLHDFIFIPETLTSG